MIYLNKNVAHNVHPMKKTISPIISVTFYFLYLNLYCHYLMNLVSRFQNQPSMKYPIPDTYLQLPISLLVPSIIKYNVIIKNIIPINQFVIFLYSSFICHYLAHIPQTKHHENKCKDYDPII